jgi:hypothetical protein
MIDSPHVSSLCLGHCPPSGPHFTLGRPGSEVPKPFRRLATVKYAYAAIILVASFAAQAQSIVVASTTSTEQSGLFSHLLPEF